MSAVIYFHRTGLVLLLLATPRWSHRAPGRPMTGSPGPRAFDPLGALGIVPAQLVAPDGAADDWFGNSVAISGDTLFVGAYRDDVGDLVDRVPSTCTSASVTSACSGSTSSLRRRRSSASSAAGSTSTGTPPWSARCTWRPVPRRLLARPTCSRAPAPARNGSRLTGLSDDVADPSFGIAVVAISDGTALVGAPKRRRRRRRSRLSRRVHPLGPVRDLPGPSSPRISMGRRTTSSASGWRSPATPPWSAPNWMMWAPPSTRGRPTCSSATAPSASAQAKLVATDGEAGQPLFGLGVELSEDTALVGCFGDDLGKGPEQGSAYALHALRHRRGSQQARLVASDGAADDEFGVSHRGWRHRRDRRLAARRRRRRGHGLGLRLHALRRDVGPAAHPDRRRSRRPLRPRGHVGG